MEIKSSPKELRQFGLTLGIFFVVVGLVTWWRHRPNVPIFLIAAGFFLFFGIVWPIILKPLQKIWMGLALVMGAVMSRLILCILFFLVITPIGLITRLLGKDFLDQSWDPNKKSYWVNRAEKKLDAEQYQRQF